MATGGRPGRTDATIGGTAIRPPARALRAWVRLHLLLVGSLLVAMAAAEALPQGVTIGSPAATVPSPPRATGGEGDPSVAAVNTEQPSGRQPNESRPVEQSPEIYYLPDEGGRLIPVPGFQYRDFLELLTLKERLPGVPRPPAAVIDRVVADVRPRRGDGDEDPACEVEIRIEIRQLREGAVAVPIGLNGLVLVNAPRAEGAGSVIIEAPTRRAETAPEGYRAWVSGEQNALHTLILTGRMPLEAIPTRESFVLDLPVATTSSCVIRSSRVDPVVSIHPSSLPPRVASGPDGGSVITCEGLAGRTRFGIGGRAEADSPGGVLPQVMVESLVRIDGRVASIEAAVRVEGWPSDRSTVRISLPPRCTLVRVRPPAMVIEGADASGDAERAGAIEVEVGRGADGAATVELECERPVDPTGRTAVDPLGFLVEGVPGWRQRGRTSLIVAGEWQLDWENPAPNRRVDPAPSARQPGFVAAFAHDAQPASLPMRVLPRASRVVVEPEYNCTIGSTRIGLAAKFRISARGAPVTRLTLGLEGWSVDEVGPAALVDAAALVARDGQVVIPFLQPLTGDAIVELRAARSIDRGEDRLEWQFPVPRVDVVGPAAVTVTADADIEVLPDGERIRGLVRQVVPASRRADGDPAPLVYRLDGEEGKFAATTRSLPRRVDVVATARAAVGEKETSVEEVLRLEVSHLPLESIDLVVPATLIADGTLEVLQSGQVLSPFALPATDAEAASAGDVVLRSLLPTPLLGTGELTLRWTLPTPETIDDSITFGVPLILPRGARLTRQSFTLLPDETLSVDLRGDVWKRDVAATAPPAQRTWVSTRPQEAVVLSLSQARGVGGGETAVEAAWFETRFLADRREDVFTYAVSTTGRRLLIELPDSCLPLRDGIPDTSAVDVRVDGVPVQGAVRGDGAVTLEQPRSAGGGRTSSLVRIAVSQPLASVGVGGRHWAVGGLLGAITLEAPRFPDGTLQRRFYWEVLLAENEHVVAAPIRWTPQQRWEWGTLGVHRVPVVTRGVLAEWVASAARSAVARSNAPVDSTRPGDTVRSVAAVEPPLLSGRSLFAGTGVPGVGLVWVVPTWLLVLIVSGPLLALGLAMVYRPGWRRLPAVFALALPATFAAVAFPDLAPLVVQAAIPGISLSFLAAGLRKVGEPVGGSRSWRRPDDRGSSVPMESAPSLVVNVDAPSDTHTAAPGRVAT